MYKVTKSHMVHLKKEKKFCHDCASDGTLERRTKKLKLIVSENLVSNEGLIESLVILLVDNGVVGFGHRKNLLNPNFRFISVAIDDDIVVQNFAY